MTPFGPFRAFVAYLAIAIVMTWPLALGLASDVPGDLGDPLLNMWILGWGAEKVPLLLSGRISLSDYWNANIFHPEPLALAFSEHLFGQVLQILPIYWSTKNLILCYNLIFLSSFPLSGLAMFLLARELLSGDDARCAGNGQLVTAAAFVAGLMFAFAPYRIGQLSHIQSLCSQWMPFALYGFRRYIVTRGGTALVGGAAALLMQHWSNGYYMLYFAPIVPVFVVHQMWATGKLRDAGMWLAFAIAGVAVAVGTAPFLLLYWQAQQVHGFARGLGEIQAFGADVHSYFTAPRVLSLWGDMMQALPKPEGELFFGLTPMVLGGLALVPLIVQLAARGEKPIATPSVVRRVLHAFAWLLALFIAFQVFALVALLLTGPNVVSFAGAQLRATDGSRLLLNLGVATGVLLLISPFARARLRIAARSPLLLAAALCVFAIWMSFGPDIHTRERVLSFPAIYEPFLEYVPGFEGLRVPSRYAMIAALFLSIMSGYGAALLARVSRRPVVTSVILSALFLAEVAALPFPRNTTTADLPAHIETADDAPAVYHVLARMPAGTVVAELPFGETATDIRFTYYSTVHWKPLVNGYSGGFPTGYYRRVARLRRIEADPDAAWRTLVDAGTTHVIVHEWLLGPARTEYIVKWLTDRFAVEIARFPEGDILFDISGTWPRW